MAEKVQCPNCLEPAEKVGNKITCVHCDSVLTVTRTGGAKAVEIGRVDKLEGRIETLEGLLSQDEPTAAELEEIENQPAEEKEEPFLPE